MAFQVPATIQIKYKDADGNVKTKDVGYPVRLITFECGHSFKTGIDDKPENHIRRTLKNEETGDSGLRYNCIQCVTLVKVVSWEGYPQI